MDNMGYCRGQLRVHIPSLPAFMDNMASSLLSLFNITLTPMKLMSSSPIGAISDATWHEGMDANTDGTWSSLIGFASVVSPIAATTDFILSAIFNSASAFSLSPQIWKQNAGPDLDSFPKHILYPMHTSIIDLYIACI